MTPIEQLAEQLAETFLAREPKLKISEEEFKKRVKTNLELIATNQPIIEPCLKTAK